MGKARSELTREFLSPLYDIEAALFIPNQNSKLAEFVKAPKAKSESAKEMSSASR